MSTAKQIMTEVIQSQPDDATYEEILRESNKRAGKPFRPGAGKTSIAPFPVFFMVQHLYKTTRNIIIIFANNPGLEHRSMFWYNNT
jgi:hypothetical protein